jgi:phosphoribosylformimino-5-aminoimidazole carboxamide ribotide isomerase
MRIIPAIDLRGGRTVRLVEGEADRETRYDLDPVEVALGFERDGAEALHLVDLDGAFTGAGEANRDVVRAILAAVHVPVELGGGLRTEDAVAAALDAGAHWAIVGTLAVESPESVASLAARYPGRVVVGIDARDGMVATRGWTERTALDAIDLARRVVAVGIERIVYTDIARDGRLQGPNFEATARLARESGACVTASGGVGTLDDIRRVRAIEADGVDSCIVGKALYEGRFTLAAAIAAAARKDEG